MIELMAVFLTWQTGLLAMAVVVVMYFLKALVSSLLNGSRQKPWVKKQLLPGLAIVVGMLLALVVVPPAVSGLGCVLLYGGVVGFFSTAFYRAVLSQLLKGADSKLEGLVSYSIRPPEDK